MSIHDIHAKLAPINARLAASALAAKTDCIRMSARIAELENALKDAEFLLRKVGINWKEVSAMNDSCLRCAEDARALLAKGN